MAPAKPQLSKVFRPFWTESLFQYDVYHSIGNYSSGGNIESLPNSNSFWETSSIEYNGRYVFNQNWALTAGINQVQANAVIANSSKTNGGPQAIKGSVEYKFNNSSFDLVLEGLGLFSLFHPSLDSIKPVYGDGAHHFGGNVYLIKRFNNTLLDSKIGFLYRTEGLSKLIPYSLGLNWKLRSITLGAQLDGFISALPDNESESYRNTYLVKTSGGSLNYRSANPNSNTLDFQAKWNITRQFSFTGGIGSNLIGKNSSSGAHYFIGMDIQWQVYQQSTPSTPLKNIIFKSNKVPNKNNQEPLFKEEDFNQDLEEHSIDSL